MRYYQCDKYPIEYVLSENIDKHFDLHNHVGHYVISVVMQGTVTVCLENREIDAGIKILVDKIAGHPEQELSIETLAADIFVSKYYFIRKFRISVGMTPHQFCIQNRIRKSQELLDEEKQSAGLPRKWGFMTRATLTGLSRRLLGYPRQNMFAQKSR